MDWFQIFTLKKSTVIGPLLIKNKPQQISKMKKFKILLSLITITILLTSCSGDNVQDLWSEEYGDDWATDYFSTNTE